MTFTPTVTPTPLGEAEYQAGLLAQKDGHQWDAYQQFEKAITLNPNRRDAVAQIYDLDRRLRQPIHLVSDLQNWKSSATSAEGWSTSLDFNASSWLPPVLGQIDQDVPRISDGDAQYIWKSEQTGSGDDAYFRREINLDKVPYSAKIVMNVDDEYDLYINGKLVGSDHASDGWKTIETYDVTNALQAGRNLIAIHGHNIMGAYSFVFSMEIEQMGPQSAVVQKALSTFPTPTVTPTVTPTNTDTPTPTFTPTTTPTSTPTPDLARLNQTLDAAWANKDWPTAIKILETLHSDDPTSKTYKDKLYASYMNYAQSLIAKGDKPTAATQYSKAIDLDRPRPEARAALWALTPTPIPPTATPKGQVSDADRAYFAQVLTLLASANEGAQTVAAQSQQLVDDPSLYGDATWRANMGAGLVLLSSGGDGLQHITPVPPELRSINADVVSLGQELSAAAQDYANGLDTISGAKIVSANQHLQTAVTLMSKINDEIKPFEGQ